MKDRELLEMAARAAGIEAQYSDNCGDFSIGKPYSREEVIWNPLTDDGDALRLAAVLEVEVSLGQCGGIVYKRRPMKESIEEISEDYMAAIRLAIVRAAAEIGKEM